ncbi:MAG TPA: uridine kinase [Bdellovibrionota bacterium]|nr:uridine kinase [Bdellovibrionota bacterium]
MFFVGIAGGSGSGKTTFAKKILQRVKAAEAIKPRADGREVALLHQDSYYLDRPPTHISIHGEPNFDHPDAFDWPLLREHLKKLRNGEAIDVPIYDYRTNHRTGKFERIGPCDRVLFEGIYTLWDAEIRGVFDVKLFLNVEADVRFIRRLHRDVRERGRSLDGIIRQYYDTVRPMHHEFLEPTRQYADLIVGEETDIAAEVLAARLIQLL